MEAIANRIPAERKTREGKMKLRMYKMPALNRAQPRAIIKESRFTL
jgi:hypothetical protein